ncbi:cysteine--tRNA ligase [Desulfogranum japonicum]|uniref:cysteine--tRNA ligase n=1 Tax=Desulfogranum japonicum TaxID=231447 RepID=UPI00048F3685|nr:cysteine--tRNA ligase [Desulfogranum japonicum]
MTVQIYNTLTRKKEPLRPLEENHVKLYVCGITSYDYCHIGHARSSLVFDMVVRYLRYRGYKVTFVRNFTDIDDKIIARANERGEDPSALALRFIDEFYTDMDALGTLRPDIEPKATEHIQEMIALIQNLVDKGLAYPAHGDVYFRVTGLDNYGRLSGRSLDDMQAGARIEVNAAKENPMDFVLWKGAKPGEPKWESPWGEGRPGWHIECSAMSKKYLGDTFDIHGGGKDLIFPHHENEIAQSCGASGKEFANVWMHHGFVTIKDEKMSKSLGNFLTIRDVLNTYDAETLRLFIFSTQYRNPLDFSEEALRDAGSGLDRIYTTLAEIEALSPTAETESKIGKKDRAKLESLQERFQQGMDNDFNTAQAIGVLFDCVKVLSKLVRVHGANLPQPDYDLLNHVAGIMKELGNILGVLTRNPSTVVAEKQQRLRAQLTITEQEIEELISRRNTARAEKNWATSDEVRDTLLEHNIVLQDGPEGTTWNIVDR